RSLDRRSAGHSQLPKTYLTRSRMTSEHEPTPSVKSPNGVHSPRHDSSTARRIHLRRAVSFLWDESLRLAWARSRPLENDKLALAFGCAALDVRISSKHAFPKEGPPGGRHHAQNDQRSGIRQFLRGVTTDRFPDLVPRL